MKPDIFFNENDISEIGFYGWSQFGVIYVVIGWGYDISTKITTKGLKETKTKNKKRIEVLNLNTNQFFQTDLIKFSFCRTCKIKLIKENILTNMRGKQRNSTMKERVIDLFIDFKASGDITAFDKGNVKKDETGKVLKDGKSKTTFDKVTEKKPMRFLYLDELFFYSCIGFHSSFYNSVNDVISIWAEKENGRSEKVWTGTVEEAKKTDQFRNRQMANGVRIVYCTANGRLAVLDLTARGRSAWIEFKKTAEEEISTGNFYDEPDFLIVGGKSDNYEAVVGGKKIPKTAIVPVFKRIPANDVTDGEKELVNLALNRWKINKGVAVDEMSEDIEAAKVPDAETGGKYTKAVQADKAEQSFFERLSQLSPEERKSLMDRFDKKENAGVNVAGTVYPAAEEKEEEKQPSDDLPF